MTMRRHSLLLALPATAVLTTYVQGNAPVITMKPADQIPYVGAKTTFSVSATGSEPLTYQWRFNGTDLSGQTANSLTLTNVKVTDAGAYSVLVSNAAGTATSDPAWLSVLPTNVVNLGEVELRFGELSAPIWAAARPDDGNPNVTRDGLTLYYGSTAPGGSGDLDIWMATRPTRSSPWDTPVNLGGTINSAAADTDARLSPDGLSLYFDSTRMGGQGDWDIWVATRPSLDAPFGTPKNLGPTINSSAEEGFRLVSADGRTLIFESRRSGGLGDYSIWMSMRADPQAAWEPARLLPAPINSPSGGTFPTALSRDGLLLFFKSWRTISTGPNISAIYVCRRSSPAAPFGEPMLIRPILGIGSGGADVCSLSEDERTLYVGTYRQQFPNWAQLVQIDLTRLPQLRALRSDLGFQMELEGRAGATYEVQTSPDLATWAAWLTTNTTDKVVLTEPGTGAAGSQRFVRVLSH
jgi:hypothetical protein